MRDNIIELYEAFILILLWPLYLYISTLKISSTVENNQFELNSSIIGTENEIKGSK
jgi:hypothetical protein